MSEISHSKNIVTGHIDAQGNVVVGDTIINLKEAAQYKAIEAEIAELNTRFERTRKRIEKAPDDMDFQMELLEIDAKRSQKQQELDSLRREVLKLAEDFQRIPLNTERLRRAKAHFEQGEFSEARAVLDAEVETMGIELDALLHEKGRLNQKTAENQQHLSDKANEYLILARLTATDYELPGRFEKTTAHFEQSLRAERNAENVFAFAHFLQEHNVLMQAQPLYEEALQMYKALAEENPRTYLPDVAMTLNNLANLQKAKNEFGEALAKYEEALQIRRALAEENPRTYLPDVAMTLNNLANLHSAKNEFGEAQAKYEEALQIRRALAEENPRTYLPNVATTLNNLAVLHSDKNEFGEALAKYEEALQIYRALAEENPRTYLPDVAMVLNNLAALQKAKNEFGEALAKYEEALQIYRALAEENPRTYLPDVAMTLNNLANLHSAKNEFGEAQAKYEEALQIYRALAEENPRTYLPDVAMVLNNLAALQKAKNEFGEALAKYEEALQIRRALAEENPRTYLPDVAMTLNNLANLHKNKNEFGEAQAKHEEALQIRRALAEENPQTYLPDVAMTTVNIAIFYLQSLPDREKSLAYCTEALRTGLPVVEHLPSVQNYLQATMQVIAAWGEDPEAFLQNTLTQMNEQASP